MSAAEFAILLHAKQVRRGHWVAKCPAHPDRRPSLSIAEGRKHPVVFRCMSQGCTQDEVLSALGLKWSDLIGEKLLDRRALRRLEQDRAEAERRRLVTRGRVNEAMRLAALHYARADALAARMAGFPSEPPERYHDELRQARRFEAIADMLDEPQLRGLGVPRFGDFPL